MAHIFVSYKHSDEDDVRELMDHIQKAGFGIWRDKENIDPGSTWRQEINKGIWDAIAVVAVISPEAIKSRYVLYEWAFALGARVPLIPVLIKPTDDIPTWITDIQHVDLTENQDMVNTLIKKLLEADALGLQYVRKLEDDLSSIDPVRRKAAVDQLAQENHPAVTEILARVVNKHSFPDVSFAAAVQLAKRDDERAVARLIDALYDEDSDIRRLATKSLIRLKDHSIPKLMEYLTVERDSSRWVIAKTLINIGEPALPGLIQLSQNQDPEVRLVSVWALGQTQTQSVRGVLEQALEDTDERVRNAADEGLKHF